MPYFKERKNKNGTITWLVQVFAGYDATGKAIMINKTSKSPRKKDAQKLARDIQKQNENGEFRALKDHVPPPEPEHVVTVADLLDNVVKDYKRNGKDWKWVGYVVGHLKPCFGHLRPAQVNTQTLEQYMDARQAKGRKPSTINNELAILHRAMQLGAESDPPTVDRVPKFRKLKVNNARQGFFEHPEYMAMRHALPEEIRPILTSATSPVAAKARSASWNGRRSIWTKEPYT